jgi:hypothetical protein
MAIPPTNSKVIDTCQGCGIRRLRLIKQAHDCLAGGDHTTDSRGQSYEDWRAAMAGYQGRCLVEAPTAMDAPEAALAAPERATRQHVHERQTVFLELVLHGFDALGAEIHLSRCTMVRCVIQHAHQQFEPGHISFIAGIGL